MAQISKNIIAVLLVLTIVASTVATLSVLNMYSGRDLTPITELGKPLASAEVSAYVKPSPVTTTGKVAVNVVVP
jgi:hypothetical protein